MEGVGSFYFDLACRTVCLSAFAFVVALALAGWYAGEGGGLISSSVFILILTKPFDWFPIFRVWREWRRRSYVSDRRFLFKGRRVTLLYLALRRIDNNLGKWEILDDDWVVRFDDDGKKGLAELHELRPLSAVDQLGDLV